MDNELRVLNRKEREHLEALQKRRDYLLSSHDHPERKGDPAYPPGEAWALAWVISVVEGSVEPMQVRVERIERLLRQHGTRIGRIEHELAEEEDDAEE